MRFKTVLDEMRKHDVDRRPPPARRRPEEGERRLDRPVRVLVRHARPLGRRPRRPGVGSGTCPGSQIEEQSAAVDRPGSAADPRRRNQPPRGDRAWPSRPGPRSRSKDHAEQAGKLSETQDGTRRPGRQGHRPDPRTARRRGRIRLRDQPPRRGLGRDGRGRREILARPETGGPAIAAETEAIELLLKSNRINPNGGGGGGRRPAAAGRGPRTIRPWPSWAAAQREGSPRGPRRLAGDRRLRAVAARGVPRGPRRVSSTGWRAGPPGP